MSTYYIKGGSNFDTGADAKVWVALHRAGFPSGDYVDSTWKDINTSGAINDPYWGLGGDGGLTQAEFGLSGGYNIKINANGISGYNPSNSEWTGIMGGAAQSLDETFDIGKIIDGADSEANSFQVGNGSYNFKMWGVNDYNYLKVPKYFILDSVAGYHLFRFNGSNKYAFKNAAISIYGDGSVNLGSSTYAFGTLYYCNLSDQTCADFSNYSYVALYDLFANWKARTDGILHKANDNEVLFPHIDFNTMPDEFTTKFHAGISEDDGEHTVAGQNQDKIIRHGVYKSDGKGGYKDATYEIHDGENAGILMGNMIYALKELVVRQYDKIEDLESRIVELEKT